jgi:hypothetical protein
MHTEIVEGVYVPSASLLHCSSAAGGLGGWLLVKVLWLCTDRYACTEYGDGVCVQLW